MAVIHKQLYYIKMSIIKIQNIYQYFIMLQNVREHVLVDANVCEMSDLKRRGPKAG